MQIIASDIEGQVDREVVDRVNRDPAIARWLWQRGTGGAAPAAIVAVKSPPRRHSTGQTDLALIAEAARGIVLIENKVMHTLSRDQCERYRQERDGLRGEGWQATTALMAPRRYLDSAAGEATQFDAQISYEAMQTQMPQNPVLTRAIERCERGYLAEGIPAVTDNFLGYQNLLRACFPSLKLMTRAGNNPTQSRTAKFEFPAHTPPGVPIVHLSHQWQEGRAKIIFWTWGEKRERLGPVIAADVREAGFYLDPNRTKSLGFMKPTPVIDNHRPFEANKPLFLAGLETVMELRSWYMNHLDIVSRWIALARGE